jgi:hypothetical protein
MRRRCGQRNEFHPPIIRNESVLLLGILKNLIVTIDAGLDETLESQLPCTGDENH